MSSLITTAELKSFVAALKEHGCRVELDEEVGTCEVYDIEDENKCVFAAIQKGYKQPWIARFMPSGRIQWADSNS